LGKSQISRNLDLKKTSTFARIMSNKDRKRQFDSGYADFLLSEFLHEAMAERHLSVRKLSEKAHVSPAMIQNLRSGKTKNISLKKLNAISSVLGYEIRLQKIAARA